MRIILTVVQVIFAWDYMYINGRMLLMLLIVNRTLFDDAQDTRAAPLEIDIEHDSMDQVGIRFQGNITFHTMIYEYVFAPVGLPTKRMLRHKYTEAG